MARPLTSKLRAENEELRLRLEEAEQALEAIRTGQVESLVVEGPDGPRIFSLEGATHSYRVLVESMNEGAATLREDGTVLYCNRRFAEMLKEPLQTVIGNPIREHISERSLAAFGALLDRARESAVRDEVPLCASDGNEIPTYLSVSSIVDDGRRVLCLVATDLREQKRTEALLAAEQAARESAERLTVTLRSIGDAVIATDEAGRVTILNSVAEQLTGWGAEEAVGRPLHEVFHIVNEHTRTPVESPVERVLREGVVVGLANHTALVARDGTKRPIADSGAPIRAADGHVSGVVLVFRDQTEERRAEAERARIGAQLEFALSTANVGWWHYDPTTRTAQYDARYQQIFGVTGHERPNDQILKLLHPDDRQRVWAAVEAALDPVDPKPYATEYRITRPDGAVRWVEVHGIASFEGEGPARRATSLDGAVADITARKQAEDELVRGRQGLSRLAEASRRVMAKTDLAGMLQAISEAALTLTDARIATCGHGDVAGQAMIGGSARAPGAPGCQPGEMFVLDKGGVHMDLVENAEAIRLTDAQLRAHPRWWGGPAGHVPLRGLLGARMVGRNGKTNGMILVTDKVNGDFTEEHESLLRQLAIIASLALQHVEARIAVEEANKAKNHFLAMLSHELRNPLAPIQNSLYILDRAVAGGEQARRAEAVIQRQVGHLTRLVDDLLDITRISRGKVQLKRERMDLNELIHRAIDDHRSVFEQNGLKLHVELPERPLWIDGDRTRLIQVVGNLLQNSAKFTELGGRISVSLATNDNLRQAVFRVRDTGVGIGADMLPRIFEPFAQAETTLARSKGGLGLGLALVKALVEMHGGNVTVESEGPGKGAEFVMRLPFDGVAPQPLVAAAPDSLLQQRILIIEDNVDAATSLREVLELDGHSVAVAYSGREGLEKARANRPDVVLCDIGLPDFDGYQVAQAIRADRAIREMRLVALTGYAAPEDVATSRAAGFNAHVAKPPSIEVLKKVLTEPKS